MSHRLAHLQKKKVQHHHQQQQPHAENQTYQQPTHSHPQNYHQPPPGRGKTGGSMARPVFPPTNQVKPFDRYAFKNGEPTYPPPQSLYTCRDTQVDPKFLRTSLTVLSGPVQKTNFPLALWVTPYANDQVCVVDVRAPLRCPRCKAYINPYFQFDGARKSVTCNLCTLRFAIDQNVDKNNMSSTDLATQGVIDFRVSDKFYMKKRTDLIKVVVLVELTMSMIQLGIVATVIDSIKSVFESHQFEEKIRVGVAFYCDQGVGFIRVGGQEEEPGVFMVPQGKGTLGCCPLSQQEFFINPNGKQEQLLKMLDFLSKYTEFIWKQGRFSHNANYTFALRCIREGFEQQAGRILLFSLLDPRAAPCAIRPRNEEQSKTPLKPLTTQGYQFAKELLKARIGVDHFIFSKDALISHELASLHFISSTTGGKLHPYVYFNAQTHGQHLYYSIFHSLTKSCYYDIDFTCRASNGLTVTRYGAGDGPRESRDVSMAVIDSTSSFSIELEQEQKLEEHNGAFVQFAAMYTTGRGERRIRVINYKFQVRNQPGAIYQSIDYLTLSSVILRNYSAKLIKGADPAKTRDEAIAFIGSIVGQVRGRCPTANVSVGDMAVTRGMAWMFAYLSSALNSRLFLNTMKLSPDARIVKYLQIQQLSPYFFASRLYPRLYPLTLDIYDVEEGSPIPGDFIEEDEQMEEQEEKIAILPQNLPLSKQAFAANGIFLADNGQELTIYVQPQSDEELRTDLFDTAQLSQIEGGLLPQLQSSHNIRISNIVAQIRRRSALHGGMFQPLVVKTPVKKGPYQQSVSNLLVEDAYECDFKTFLQQVIKGIMIPKS